ncbi:alanine racemase [Thermoflavimicrobium daqui]|uniref:Alanine racemase n=1 Tax=Thermoflavimicrobium daqui TaxID=2137476 RepID=A0A364K252_9BACL|nr:alanine racemase [Thermoflavimicrobium daqui]
MNYGRDTIIEVDLDAIRYNVQQFKQYLPIDTRILVAVKGNAYGHGATYVSQAAIEAGAHALGVAFVDEGIELRNAGIEAPILVLGFTPTYAIKEALKYRLSFTVYNEDHLYQIQENAKNLGLTANVHLKIDTGMGRLGILPEEIPDFLQVLLNMSHVRLEGVFTHFATADEKNKMYLNYQYNRFLEAIHDIKRSGIAKPIIHCANSAAAIEIPNRIFDMVRIGISLYGLYPSPEVDRQKIHLQPALTLKSKVIHLKQSPPGTGISYGKTYIARGDEWIAVVPIGYADGFSRHLSNRGFALVRGIKVPIVGRVCMDQLMLDVTKAMPVQIGDEVVLYGKQEDAEIHVDEVAKQLDTINYEVTSMLSRRIPRIYLQDGKPIAIINELRKLESLSV